MTKDQPQEEIYILNDEERASIERSKAQSERGEFVPDEVIEAFWRKLGL